MNTSLTKDDPVVYKFALEQIQKFFDVKAEQAEVMIGFCELRNVDKKTILTEEGGLENYPSIGYGRSYYSL
jgi:hypothetical protein